MRSRLESAVTVLITAGVGGIGAAAGFTHTHDAAVAAGQHGWLAWADAVVIECMVIVAGLQLARARRLGKSVALPVTVLVIAFLIQMGAQVAGAPATFAGWLFAAVPALGCLVVVKFAFMAAHDQPEVERPAEVIPVEPAHAVAAEAVRVDEPKAELPAALPNVQAAVVAAPVAAWPPAA